MASLLFVKLTRIVQHNRFKSSKIVHDQNSTFKDFGQYCVKCMHNKAIKYFAVLVSVSISLRVRKDFILSDKYGLWNKQECDGMSPMAARDAFNL